MTNTAMSEHVPDNPSSEDDAPGVSLEIMETRETTATTNEEITPQNLEPMQGALDLTQAKLTLEAALLSSSEPLQLTDLKKLFDQELSAETIRKLLDELKSEWANRALELTPVASGWRFRVKPEFARFVQRMNPEKPPRYSRAVLETLAIIAYRQPATRGDIEQIRGVQVSPQIIKTLEERGWIEAVGHREVPGRPALFGTTKRFLDDLNLRSLDELPPLDELQATLDMTTAESAPAREELPLVGDDHSAAPESEITSIIEIEPAFSDVCPPEATHDQETNTVPPAGE